MLGLSPCVGIFPCFRLNVYCMFCLRICVKWHLDNPTTMSSLGVRGMVLCFVAQEGYVQASGPASAAKRDLPAMGDWCQLLKVILLCAIVTWVKYCFIPCLSASCFSWQLQHREQWAEVFGLLLLILGNRCHLLDTYPGKRKGNTSVRIAINNGWVARLES